MRKVFISDENLNRIIQLRQSGNSWLKIQEQTDVRRRSAQKAYEDWQRNQSIEELKDARVHVAADIFRNHVDELIRIIDLLANVLDIPTVRNIKMHADEYLNFLWEKDYKEKMNYAPTHIVDQRERKRFIRDYQILLKSLEYHTREKVHWKSLENWKAAWNKCLDYASPFNEEIDSLAADVSFNTLLLEALNIESNNNEEMLKISDVVLDVIWGNIYDGTLDAENPKIEVGKDLVERLLPLHYEKEQLETVAQLIIEIAGNFIRKRKKDIILPLMEKISELNEVIRPFEEELNPLVLRPLIIRTRCDICPV